MVREDFPQVKLEPTSEKMSRRQPGRDLEQREVWVLSSVLGRSVVYSGTREKEGGGAGIKRIVSAGLGRRGGRGHITQEMGHRL